MNTDERLNALRGAVARLARASGWSRVGAHNECCRDHSGADCSQTHGCAPSLVTQVSHGAVKVMEPHQLEGP